MKLSFSIFLIFLVACANAAKLESVEKARDLVLFMRIPDEVCADTKGMETEIRSQGHLQYDQLIQQFRGEPRSKAENREFFSRARLCLKACTCQIYEELEDLFSPTQAALLVQVKSQSHTMTDDNYRTCQKTRRLNCQSDVVKALLGEVKKARAETQP